MRMKVRELTPDAGFVERDGNLSLGGAFVQWPETVTGHAFEIRFPVAPASEEVSVTGSVLGPGRGGIRLRFTELPLETELAIARLLDLARG